MKIAVAGGTGTVGRRVVEAAREREHEVVILSRAAGVDLTTGTQLAQKLHGVDAVIDVASVATQSGKKSMEFFGTVTKNLLDAEERAGVHHHLALSIVGSNTAPFGYYAGKALQEELVSVGPVPWTILRATQFFEFAQQIYGRIRIGPINVVPKMVSQPVAAREVGRRLVALAEGGPVGRPSDLAGPEVLRMVDMVRAYSAATGGKGPILELPIPGSFGKAMRNGSLTAGTSADLGTQTFADWLREITH